MEGGSLEGRKGDDLTVHSGQLKERLPIGSQKNRRGKGLWTKARKLQ